MTSRKSSGGASDEFYTGIKRTTAPEDLGKAPSPAYLTDFLASPDVFRLAKAVALGLFRRPGPMIRLHLGSKEREVSKFSAALLLQLVLVCLLARLRAEPQHPLPMYD
jgi:hypothetical protein